MEENKEVETITNEEQPVQEQPTVQSVEPNNNDKKGNNKKLITIILIIAAGLCVVFAVVFFVFFNHSDKDDDYDNEPDVVEKEDEDKKETTDDETKKDENSSTMKGIYNSIEAEKEEKIIREYDENGYIHYNYIAIGIPVFKGDNYSSRVDEMQWALIKFEVKDKKLIYTNSRIGVLDSKINEKIKYMTVGISCDGTRQILVLTESNKVFISNTFSPNVYTYDKSLACKIEDNKECPNIEFKELSSDKSIVNITLHADPEGATCTGTNLAVVLSDGSIRSVEKNNNSYTLGTQNLKNMELKN